MWRRELSADSPEAMETFAAALASCVKPGEVVCLEGELGAGKTTFARGFIQRFLPGEEVTSPTFTLVKTYAMPGGELWHYDLYRLEDAEQLWELGIEESLHHAVSLIEWPQIAASLLPEERLTVRIAHAGEGRKLCLEGKAEIWKERLEQAFA